MIGQLLWTEIGGKAGENEKVKRVEAINSKAKYNRRHNDKCYSLKFGQEGKRLHNSRC